MPEPTVTYTWRIKNDTYNRLNDTWQNNFDFIMQ